MVMTMTEELIGYDIHASFDGASQFQAANVERRYRVTTDDGTYERRARGIVADLAAVVPSSDMMVQVASLTSQLADMTADRDAQKAARETALSEAQTAKVAAETSAASLAEQLAAAQARIAELEQPVPLVNGVPQQVTNYQARSALISADLFSAVDAAVRAQGPASQAYQAWEYANVFSRSSPFIVDMGAALGLTAEQIDALFVAAAQVN